MPEIVRIPAHLSCNFVERRMLTCEIVWTPFPSLCDIFAEMNLQKLLDIWHLTLTFSRYPQDSYLLLWELWMWKWSFHLIHCLVLQDWVICGEISCNTYLLFSTLLLFSFTLHPYNNSYSELQNLLYTLNWILFTLTFSLSLLIISL